ncbi:MAG: tyrosine-type recombinase/integrase [Actinomycetota bacterium]
MFDCYLKPHLGHLHVAKLTTEDIDDFYGHLLRAGGRRDQPLTHGTVARVHGVLHRALAQAVRWEWIWLNAASYATPPWVAPANIRPPSHQQVAVLLEWARQEDPPLFCFLRLAVSTGARRSQLLALQWGDVDEEGTAVAFTRALIEGPNGPELRATKTHRTYRVELDGETWDVLIDHRSRVEAQARRAAVELSGEAFVFSSRPDCAKPWLPNWLTKQFIAARRAAGLPHFRLHDLRHFMATEMLAAGVPIATVSQRLSHARASTTLNVYAHAVPGGDRKAKRWQRSWRPAAGRSAIGAPQGFSSSRQLAMTIAARASPISGGMGSSKPTQKIAAMGSSATPSTPPPRRPFQISQNPDGPARASHLFSQHSRATPEALVPDNCALGLSSLSWAHKTPGPGNSPWTRGLERSLCPGWNRRLDRMVSQMEIPKSV